MENLIRFVIDTAWVMIAVLAVIGFAALLVGIGVILYKEIKDLIDTEPKKGEE